jgi:hypothetical protein
MNDTAMARQRLNVAPATRKPPIPRANNGLSSARSAPVLARGVGSPAHVPAQSADRIATVSELVRRSLLSSGRPLDSETRTAMESRRMVRRVLQLLLLARSTRPRHETVRPRQGHEGIPRQGPRHGSPRAAAEIAAHMSEEVKVIKAAVALRSAEFGVPVRPRDISVEVERSEIAPGCRLFRTSWGVGRRRNGLSGLLLDDESPDTFPGQALTKVFSRWLAAEGRLPQPLVIADAASYLLDPLRCRTVIRTPADLEEYATGADRLRHISVPEAIDIGGNRGVAFWWIGEHGASRFEVYIDADGRLHTGEKPVRSTEGGDSR